MPLRFSIALVCSSVALVDGPGRAQEEQRAAPPAAWKGVWQGAIGQMPVHVCLEQTDYERKGAYYYDRVKRLLRLVPGKADGAWFEQETYDKNGARWSISEHNGALRGTWRQGAKELPVRLTRIEASSKEDEGPCGSLAFHRPRLAPVHLASRHAIQNGASYTSWTFKPGPWLSDEVQITTFTLDGPSPQLSKINSLLRAALPRPDGTGEWLDCVAGNVSSSGMDGSYSKTIEPTVITDHWLAAKERGEYNCGGLHPDTVNTPRTFDLAHGIEVDPLDWLGPKAVHRENLGSDEGVYKTLTPAFIAVLLRGWKNRKLPECDEATRRQDSWSAGIARGALIFSPNFPHAMMVCSDDFKVPVARLERWLNDEGRAAVATLPR